MTTINSADVCHLVAPVEHLPDVAKHAVLDDDEGWRHLVGQVDNTQSLFHLKGVDVGVEGVGEPGSGHSIFIGAVVQLGIDCYCIEILTRHFSFSSLNANFCAIL